MRYSEAVLTAPPGAASFQATDLARLPRSTLRRVLAPGPSAPPLEDVAAALAGSRQELFAIASALPPARGERLLRLSQRPVAAAEAEAAAERLPRGLFWALVYELAPERWSRLAELEHLPEALLAALPVDGGRVLEVAAGTGRLIVAVAERTAHAIAAEPAAPLRAILAGRLAGRGEVVAALTQELPFRDASFDAVLCCAAISPDPPLGGPEALAELERVTRAGGCVALVGPEQPDWFEARGYARRDFAVPAVPAPDDVAKFFGQLDPPHSLLTRRP